MKKKRANVVLSVAAFFAVFFVFCGFAIDFSMIIVTRSQLQTAVETAVLSAATEVSSGTAQATAVRLIEYNKIKGAEALSINEIRINEAKKAIWVKATAPAKTYFLSALGIHTIDLQAQSAAMVEPYTLNQETEFVLEDHLQYKSPILILAKEGPEIRITRAPTTQKYRVFAGLNAKSGETRWVELTCSTRDAEASVQFFDLDADCVKDNVGGNVSAAQFIRVVNNTATAPFAIEKVELIGVSKLIRSADFQAL